MIDKITRFHERDELSDGTPVGKLGSLWYILDDTGRPISDGHHEIRIDNSGAYVGEIGSLTETIEIDNDARSKRTAPAEEMGLPTIVERDNQCQLCRVLDYRGVEINEPGGIVTIPNVSGGIKTIHCCERCANEFWGDKSDWSPYDDGGLP